MTKTEDDRLTAASATLATIAFCPPEVPADALRMLAMKAVERLYPDLAAKLPVGGKMVHYLKCDAKGCMHLEVHPELTWDMVDKPCPNCGANLLTQADADAYPYMAGDRPTRKVECAPCRGRGYIQWHPHWDNGTDDCERCNGTGYVEE